MTVMKGALAVIPARGGSKRIPRKNIKLFHGRPIIEYAIEAATASNVFSEVMVSTDDEEIAEIATKAGAKVPFMRSKTSSDDFATMGDAVIEVLKEYEKLGKVFSHFACVYSTAPFVQAGSLKRAYQLILDNKADSVIAVTAFGFPIQRALKVTNGNLSMFWPEHQNTRSQDLEPAYHDAGQFFFCESNHFIANKRATTNRTAPIIIPESQTQDIDTEEDWLLAEIKFQNLIKRAKL